MRSRLNQKYKERKIELLERIEFCKENREKIIKLVEKLNEDYDYGIINNEEYTKELNSALKGKTPEQWIEYYNNNIKDYERQLKECNENIIPIKLPYKIVLFAILMLLIVSSAIFFRPEITGLFVANEPTAAYEDGYSIEGVQDRWADINGEMMYARCLKIKSDIEFDGIEISGKLTNAQESNNLMLSLYSHNNETDEPLEELGNCRVNDYSTIWKSCSINLELQQLNNYWICAYVDSGNKNTTYFTIAYQNGDDSKKRALWTGTNWQKLEKSSYTIKAKFIKW